MLSSLHPVCRRDGRTLAPGELDSGSSQWAHRQKELLSRRLYLKHFWYAAGEWGLDRQTTRTMLFIPVLHMAMS